MGQDYKNPTFKKLLVKLQEESWQLELIISGFAIFGLVSVWEPLSTIVNHAQNSQQIYKFVISLVALISCSILVFNLLLHVLLRGLWIGTLGLRYVSGDIDYDSLKYSEKFTKYLKKKVGSFDKYIATLENYCSIIFAISFLLIFYVLAITFTILSIALIATYIIDNDNLPSWFSNGFGIPLMLFIVIGMLFTFIDFITLGFLKKKKWISRIYFPIYWVFSFVTLSFLYRPLVYNFLDNKFGRRLSFVLVPFYILILMASTLKYSPSNYITSNLSSNNYIANNNNYEDLIDENKGLIDKVAINSKIITDNYLKVFVVFKGRIESNIYDYNKSLIPKNDSRGLTSNIEINGGENISSRKKDSLRREYLKVFNTLFYTKIDSLKYNSEFILAKSKNGELGFETYLNTKNLTEGKHLLKVNRMRIQKGDTTYWKVSEIPFFVFQ